jgi:hypothetical protein
MGAQLGNTRLAGEASARLREAASKGIQMRREAWKNKGEARDQTRAYDRNHNKISDRDNPGKPPVTGGNNPGAKPATGGNNPGTFGGFVPVSQPIQVSDGTYSEQKPSSSFDQSRSEFSEEGSPAYDEMMQRLRSSNTAQNSGPSF